MPTVSEFRRKLALALTLFATVLLAGASIFDYKWAKSMLVQHAHEELDKDWGAMKGYLRLEYNPATKTVQDSWYYDRDDLDQATSASRLRNSCLIIDETGRVLHQPPMFQGIGNDLSQLKPTGTLDSSASSTLQIKNGGVGYVIRTGVVLAESQNSRYFVALAKPVFPEQSALLPFEVYTLGAIV